MAQSYGSSKASNPDSVHVDEQGLTGAHEQAYQNGNAGSLDAKSMGAAAAMQVSVV